ncbi:hypothetical protein ACI3EY_16610 [Ornithinimicrobium sp. LYQ92]|uniref:hypothetical protein n=1 Tax=Serinicoccus sp. LYQ92 TaxID=3378798 RepID=UPI003852C77F
MDAADRVLTLVREAVPTLTVFDSKVPSVDQRPSRFVVVYIPPGLREAGNVGGVADRRRVTWQVTSLATGDDPGKINDLAWQARWAATKIRDHLVANRITPSGSLIGHTLSTRQGDDDQLVTTQAVGMVDQYEALA